MREPIRPSPRMPSVLPAKSNPDPSLPQALAHRAVLLRNAMGEREHQRHGHLDGRCAGTAGLRHQNALRGGSGEIDLTGIFAGQGQELERRQLFQDAGGKMGALADGNQDLIGTQPLNQFSSSCRCRDKLPVRRGLADCFQ